MRGTRTHLRKPKVDAAFTVVLLFREAQPPWDWRPPLWCLAAAGWDPDIGFVRILTVLNCIFVNRVVAKLSAAWSFFANLAPAVVFQMRYKLRKMGNHAIT